MKNQVRFADPLTSEYFLKLSKPWKRVYGCS